MRLNGLLLLVLCSTLRSTFKSFRHSYHIILKYNTSFQYSNSIIIQIKVCHPTRLVTRETDNQPKVLNLEIFERGDIHKKLQGFHRDILDMVNSGKGTMVYMHEGSENIWNTKNIENIWRTQTHSRILNIIINNRKRIFCNKRQHKATICHKAKYCLIFCFPLLSEVSLVNFYSIINLL